MRRRFAPLIALVPVAFALIAASAAAGAAKFPEEFLWGTAIAGFQTEAGQGRNVDPASDWFAWTHDPANIADGSIDPGEMGDGQPRPGQGMGDPTRRLHGLHVQTRNLIAS